MSVINEQTAVRVKNTGTVPFRDSYANQPYVILPGQEIIVPYHGAVYWFGDPRAVDLNNGDMDQQYRTMEVRRLSVKYGVYDETFWSPDPNASTQIVVHDDTMKETFDRTPLVGGRHPNLPTCEVVTLTEPIQRLWTVIEDPEGTHIAPQKIADPEIATIRQELENQRLNTERLMTMLAQKDPAAAEALGQPAEPVDLDDITESLDADPVPVPTPAQKDTPQRQRKARASANAPANGT